MAHDLASPVHRRDFLLRLAGATALGVAATACAPRAGYDAASLARPDLLAALGADRVRAIGARYRATSGEQDADTLRHAILDARPLGARMLGSAYPVAALVRDDFAAGRTVEVDGWILSRTEARQCALYSLVPA